jgi:hypothetical protein
MRSGVQVARRPNNLAPERHRGRIIPRYKTVVINLKCNRRDRIIIVFIIIVLIIVVIVSFFDRC